MSVLFQDNRTFERRIRSERKYYRSSVLRGWVTGLIFFLIDKRPFVRFHATQSVVVFGGVNLAYIILTNILVTGFRAAGLGFFSFSRLLLGALSLGGMVLWIVLMVKAYQGERFRVPIASNLAESLATKDAR
ncbi:MAG TPA: DUF4870 domain-containing protein [Steroidobacteraceae bacterium]|nr:DUF4870 domain-containing protein [Steroidobacteraceae bacterium]